MKALIKVENHDVLVNVWHRDTWSNMPQADMDVTEIDGLRSLDFFMKDQNEYFRLCDIARPIAYALIVQ